jgi:hypothetical protein
VRKGSSILRGETTERSCLHAYYLAKRDSPGVPEPLAVDTDPGVIRLSPQPDRWLADRHRA